MVVETIFRIDNTNIVVAAAEMESIGIRYMVIKSKYKLVIWRLFAYQIL